MYRTLYRCLRLHIDMSPHVCHTNVRVEVCYFFVTHCKLTSDMTIFEKHDLQIISNVINDLVNVLRHHMVHPTNRTSFIWGWRLNNTTAIMFEKRINIKWKNESFDRLDANITTRLCPVTRQFANVDEPTQPRAWYLCFSIGPVVFQRPFMFANWISTKCN